MRRYVFLFLVSCLLVSCGGTPNPLPVPLPTDTPPPLPSPTPTVDFATPETVGRTFLAAWESGDYDAMYTLLTPSARAVLSADEFHAAYQNALRTTTTVSVTVALQTLNLEADRAWIVFVTEWETALFGTLRTTNQLDLLQQGGQWWVAWQRGCIWPDLAEGNRFVIEYQVPPRANIYDQAGAGLAIPSTIVTVGVVPDQFEDEASVLSVLSQMFNMSPEELRAIYAGQPSSWYIPVGEITGEDSTSYDEWLNLPGIQRRESQGRIYPSDGVGAHVVGWVSPIPVEELATYRRQGYRDDAWVGISGLEAWGESILAGRNGGRLYLVDSEGQYVRSVAERQPERGRAVYTTLDRDMQAAAETFLGDRSGAIVALDVHTGAILAMASAPHFDNNIFIRATAEQERQAALNDPRRLFFNRALQGLYPCGSVFKIVTMAAGLESGIVTPDSVFNCPGYWDGLGEQNRKTCWLETGHGDITLVDGLSASCNVVFYELGWRLNSADQGSLSTYGHAFGLGVPTGLQELPESEGLVPDPEWKQMTYNEAWAAGDAVNLAIGQGYLLVTPLQIARMVAAVANGGTLYRPYLVGRIDEGSGYPEQLTQPQATGQLPLSASNLSTIQSAMLNVTSSYQGTATGRFVGLGIPVAGKTGTAQTSEGQEPHSWFAGYFPADDPEIAMVVLVENGGEGPSVAAPMFRQMVESYYDLAITPLPAPEEIPQGD
ncbi:MAG: penicillin-binding protein 2 [Anaerolineae bacterium]|nr:penicillin-binding protein 2 [Anaerolineae bacterium]